jgi:hypothetical protein
MLKDMPEVGSSIATEKGKGVIIEVNAITKDMKVKMEADSSIVTIKK